MHYGALENNARPDCLGTSTALTAGRSNVPQAVIVKLLFRYELMIRIRSKILRQSPTPPLLRMLFLRERPR